MSVDEHKSQVHRFYRELWDAHDASVMPEILHADVTFRGSLGQDEQGHAGVAAYIDQVHAALDEYRCHIEALVAEDERVFARMRFAGIHRNTFLGYAGTGRPVSWSGCALFTFRDGRISDIWVLGDLDGLKAHLESARG